MNILHMSIYAGILIIVIVLIRIIALNRLPKTVFLVLWGIAVCRLLIPVTLPWQYSIYSIVDQYFKDATVNITDSIISMPQEIVSSESKKVIYIAPIKAIWLMGMIIMAIGFTGIFIRSRRELRFILPICHNEILKKWLAEHKLFRKIRIMQSESISTPVAIGIISPKIILPKYMSMENQQLLKYVLTHEYCHIKRLDALWKLILVCALCIHWFNPLVWLMLILASRDLEIACDEMVIRHFGIDKKTSYAYSLISLAEQRSKLGLFFNGFYINAEEERIVSIMKMKKISIGGSIAAVLLVICIATIFATTKTPAPIYYTGDLNALPNSSISKKEVLSKAKEIELSNMLLNFKNIDGADVSLSLADDISYASVVLTVHEAINDTEANSIAQLIYKSVENIEKENINVKDQNANTIYPLE